MRKLCVIYNTFGGNGRNNTVYYMDALKSLMRQDFNAHYGEGAMQLVVSGCLPPEPGTIWNEFTSVNMNYINELLPANITCNHTIKKMREAYGDFEAYVYIDSGINFWNFPQGIRILYETFLLGKYAIVACDPSNDKGYEHWGAQHLEGTIDVPLGTGTNAHCNLYSHDFISNYGKVFTDAFQNDTSESVATFLCAAMNKKMALEKKCSLFHNHNMDGGSMFRGRPVLHPAKKKSIEEMCAEGAPYGFGYEEVNKVLVHDASKFDATGYALDNRLKAFLRENVYLTDSEFNYGAVVHAFRKSIT